MSNGIHLTEPRVWISLSCPRSWAQIIVNTCIAFAVQVGVIGLGVVVGSPAMQWCGFAAVALMAVGLAVGKPPLTPQQAADKLLADYGVVARPGAHAR